MKWLLALSPFTALLAFLPGVGGFFSVIAEFLKPFAKALADFIVWLVTQLWDGAKNALDSLTAVLFVLTVAFGTYYYTLNFGEKRVAAEQEIVKLVQQVKDLKKKCGVKCGR